MSGGRGTDERLRYHLNTNQPERERLFAHILQLDPDYRDVRPRLPNGGPDDGRDLEAVHSVGGETYGACGFVNDANGQASEIKQITNKFKEDLKRALDAKADLKSFAFATNVDLSPGEEDVLTEHARVSGIVRTDIYDRERLRLKLDRPEAYGLRLEFLGVEMSKEEQVSFFREHGKELQAAILGKLSPIQEAIDRLEFAAELQRPIRDLAFVVRFRSPISDEILAQPYRVLAELVDERDGAQNTPPYCLGMAWELTEIGDTDPDDPAAKPGGTATVRQAFDFAVQGGPSPRHSPMLCYTSHPDLNVWDARPMRMGSLPMERVHELEHFWLRIHVTANLASEIDLLCLVANNYCVGEWPLGRYQIVRPHQPPDWPELSAKVPDVDPASWRLLKPTLTYKVSHFARDSFPVLAQQSARRADFLWQFPDEP